MSLPKQHVEQLVIEFGGVDEQLLFDRMMLCIVADKAAETAGAKVVQRYAVDRGLAGASVILTLDCGHITIHTWAEESLAVVDILMWGIRPDLAFQYIRRYLHAESCAVSRLHRATPNGFKQEFTHVKGPQSLYRKTSRV